jgi:hypothetical protein
MSVATCGCFVVSPDIAALIRATLAEEFVNTNPNVAGGRGSASNFYRRVK